MKNINDAVKRNMIFCLENLARDGEIDIKIFPIDEHINNILQLYDNHLGRALQSSASETRRAVKLIWVLILMDISMDMIKRLKSLVSFL